MYEFTRGPLVWLAFLVFFIGSLYRIISIIRLAKKDKVVWPYMNFKYGFRSILHWIIPFGSRNMRIRFVFTLLSFLFHICLILTPIFTLGHIAMFRESWGFSWISLPNDLSKLMTFIVIITGIYFILRRIADNTVRFVSSISDFVLICIVLGPFVTGLLSYFQVFNYEIMIIVHIWSGTLWLSIIPFTRIAHMLFFPLTRAYMGCEFGYVRNTRDW